MKGIELQNILACPICQVLATFAETYYYCSHCNRQFPLRFGIPDFRIFPDPYISIDEEVAKVARILGDKEYSFVELVDRYYQFTPEVSEKLQPRYKEGLKTGVIRAENFLTQMEKAIPITDRPLLDIGCGTSGLTLLAQQRYTQVIGIDIALRWLIIGQKRLAEAGLTPLLVCANAEALPFTDNVFAGIISDSVLEHVDQAKKMLSEAARVTKPQGFFFINTANRYSLLEAYTGFPLAGLIPKQLRWKVIEKICQTPYKLNPVSVSELRYLLANTQDLRVQAYKPVINAALSQKFFSKQLITIYEKMLTSNIGNKILAHLGFFISASGYFVKNR